MLSNSRNFYVVEIPYNVFNEMYLPSIYRTMGIARALQVGSIYLKKPLWMLHTNEYNYIYVVICQVDLQDIYHWSMRNVNSIDKWFSNETIAVNEPNIELSRPQKSYWFIAM